MTGGELSAEERGQMRKDAEGTIRLYPARFEGRLIWPSAVLGDHVLALLDALDAAEARVAAVEAERNETREALDGCREQRADLLELVHVERAENRRLSALVEAGLALADRWRSEREAYPVLTDYRASISEVAVRLCEDELRVALGGTECEHEWHPIPDPADGYARCAKCGVRIVSGGAS